MQKSYVKTLIHSGVYKRKPQFGYGVFYLTLIESLVEQLFLLKYLQLFEREIWWKLGENKLLKVPFSKIYIFFLK